MNIWVVLEITACLVIVPFRQKTGFLLYEFIVAGIYLLSLTMVQELDYTMSVYFAFAVFPYLNRFRVPNRAALLCILYFFIITLVSLTRNDMLKVASILVIHYLGPLILIFVFSNIERDEFFPPNTLDFADGCRCVLLLGALFETVIGVLAISQSADGRLMLNYQCVSGCISCFSILLTLYLIKINRHVILAGCLALYFLLWAFASGTRGYIVIACVLIAFAFILLKDARARIMLILIAVLTIVGLITFLPELIQGVVDGSRIGESVGRRTYENIWFLKFFPSLSPVNQMFGIGIGSVYGEWRGACEAMLGVGAGTWDYNVIMISAKLHNFWYSALLATGVIGMTLYIAPFFLYARSFMDLLDKRTFVLLITFMAVYAFVLWFRWTATGGILESAVLAVFVRLSVSSKPTPSHQLAFHQQHRIDDAL